MNHRILLFFIGPVACACSSEARNDSGRDTEPDLYSLNLRVGIESQDGIATFLTPTASPQQMETAHIIGKPWYMGFFEAGAIPGIDVPVHDAWGEVGSNLEISYTTPSLFESGPYDAVAVIYVEAEVQEQDKEEVFAPAAVTGDLASFTLAEQVVEEGDPELHLAFLRFKVEDAHTTIAIQNKTPVDWDSDDQLLDAYTDTVLIVP